jgi:hypothetical protein
MSDFTVLPSVAFIFVPLNMMGESIWQLTGILECLVNVCLLGTFFTLLQKIGMQNT